MSGRGRCAHECGSWRRLHGPRGLSAKDVRVCCAQALRPPEHHRDRLPSQLGLGHVTVEAHQRDGAGHRLRPR